MQVQVPKFFFEGGEAGSEDRGGGVNSIQFINFRRVNDKSFKEWRQKIGGGRVDETVFRLFVLLYSIKNAIFPFIFTRICLFIELK